MKTKDIRLAQIRYFETEHNAVEIPPITAYTFLINLDGEYFNLFNLQEKVPVYKRVPYSNRTSTGENYGSKIQLVEGEVKDGLCYVIENTDTRKLFDKEEVTMTEIEDYILDSALFFVERFSLLHTKKSVLDKFHYFQKLLEDSRRIDALNKFLAEHEEGVVYRKIQR